MPMNITPITPALSVSPQLRPEDLASLAAAGFRAIINNRPDDEESGQPRSAAFAAEAKRLGLFYRHIPIVPGRQSDRDAGLFAEALRHADGPVLAFCRTGARSTNLWKLSEHLRAQHGC